MTILDYKVAYIDTEGTFRPDRIRAIAERFNVDADAALENIVVVRPTPIDSHRISSR